MPKYGGLNWQKWQYYIALKVRNYFLSLVDYKFAFKLNMHTSCPTKAATGNHLIRFRSSMSIKNMDEVVHEKIHCLRISKDRCKWNYFPCIVDIKNRNARNKSSTKMFTILITLTWPNNNYEIIYAWMLKTYFIWRHTLKDFAILKTCNTSNVKHNKLLIFFLNNKIKWQINFPN